MRQNSQQELSCLSRRQALAHITATGVALAAGSALGTEGISQRQTENLPVQHADWHEELSRHRIERIESRVIQNHWPRLVGRNARRDTHGRGRDVPIAIIHTDRGASGWGLAYGNNEKRAGALTEQFGGKRVTELFDVNNGTVDNVPKGLDVALHDLAGVILSMPVYQMLGAKGPRETPIYSGMIYFDDLEPYDNPVGIDQVLFNAAADRAFGYRQMKIKVGRGARWMEPAAGLRRDIDVTRALADAFPDVKFLADANDGYSLDDTKAYLTGIGDVDLLFMEEPFRENTEGFAALRGFLRSTGSKTLIADGESDADQELLDELIDADLLDVHLTDVIGLGFTNWRRLLPRLADRGVKASPHTWGLRLKTVYATHLAAGLGNVLTVEGVTAFSSDVDLSAYDPENGRVSPPPLPGFGLSLSS